MKGLLGTVGLGFLVCLPCLAVIAGGFGLAAGGASLVAFAQHPLVQATGVLLVLAAIVVGYRYLMRMQRACPQCELERTQGTAPGTVRHELHT